MAVDRPAAMPIARPAVAVALFTVPMSVKTLDFDAYRAASGFGYGQAERLNANSLAFPGFALSTTYTSLQLDERGYFGLTNCDLLGEGALNITFSTAQSGFSIDLRGFSGYGGNDTIPVYRTDEIRVAVGAVGDGRPYRDLDSIPGFPDSIPVRA